MTIKQGEKLLKPFIDECEKGSDPYFVVHFSRNDDRFNGNHNGLDKGDALIIINKLVKEFDIEPMALTKDICDY